MCPAQPTAMDLATVTASLAAVKRGLDELDTRVRQQLAGCAQLRQALAEERSVTVQLQQQAEAARGAVFAAEEQRADVAVVLQCCRDQVQLASSRRQQLQDGIRVLRTQLSELVVSCEGGSERFCAQHQRAEVEQQRARIQAAEVAAAAGVKASLRQLLSAKQQCAQQQLLVAELRQHVSDGRAATDEVARRLAAEGSTHAQLLLELDAAQATSAAAQQVAHLQREVAARERELLEQQCRVATQEAELSAAKSDLSQKHQQAVLKHAKLADLSKAIHALGLRPALDQSSSRHMAAPAHNPHHGLAAGRGTCQEGAPKRHASQHLAAPAVVQQQRAHLTLSETVVTQTLTARPSGNHAASAAAGTVLQRRVLVQVEEQPSRSGSRLVPSKRTVLVEECQQSSAPLQPPPLPCSSAAQRHDECQQPADITQQQQHSRAQPIGERASVREQRTGGSSKVGTSNKAPPASSRAASRGARKKGGSGRPVAHAAVEHSNDAFGSGNDW